MFGSPPPNPQAPPPAPTFASMKPVYRPEIKGGGFQSTIATGGQGDLSTPNLAQPKKTLLGQ